MSFTLGAMASGPQIGIFVCGLFLPWVNERVSWKYCFAKKNWLILASGIKMADIL